MVNNSCYRLLAGRVDQPTGRTNCLAAGGRLALVSTAEEMSALQAYMLRQGANKTWMWVDGTDAVTEAVWLTDSGDVMSYTGFTDKEPDGGVGENCIAVAVDSVIDIRCVRNAYVYYTLCEL